MNDASPAVGAVFASRPRRCRSRTDGVNQPRYQVLPQILVCRPRRTFMERQLRIQPTDVASSEGCRWGQLPVAVKMSSEQCGYGLTGSKHGRRAAGRAPARFYDRLSTGGARTNGSAGRRARRLLPGGLGRTPVPDRLCRGRHALVKSPRRTVLLCLSGGAGVAQITQNHPRRPPSECFGRVTGQASAASALNRRSLDALSQPGCWSTSGTVGRRVTSPGWSRWR